MLFAIAVPKKSFIEYAVSSRKGISTCSCVIARLLSTSAANLSGGKWRLEQGLGKCGNEYGPLQEIPDWSYADGRPAPLGPREKLRRHKNKELAVRAVRLMEEMTDAKRRYAGKKDVS